ncbi:ABC transporter permease [Actinocorallia longicatena]|uniref:Transport permease protein n=1 Tax=Actinocorallia longicatena TaxID=111803 RepID=A0ABP6QM95_9ACTN
MNPRVTLATARRILDQLKHDKRTIALIVVVPTLLMTLLRYVFDDAGAFDRIGPMLLGIFPFVIMFLVTSIGTLRERTGGTLERLMTTPLGKLDLLLGYAIAFGLTALAQVGLILAFSLTVLGLDVNGPIWGLVAVALLDALLGVALGLLGSAFAKTEFQAVQLLPLVVLPQLLLCGLFAPRDSMQTVLDRTSDFMPLSYAVDAMRELTTRSGVSGDLAADMLIIAGCGVAALVLGAATLPRRTP